MQESLQGNERFMLTSISGPTGPRSHSLAAGHSRVASFKKIFKNMEKSIIGRGGVSDVKFHNSKKYILIKY